MSDSFILRVLRAFARCDSCDGLFWRTDGEYAPVTFFANCNDTFWWGTADGEQITPENIAVLERTAEELAAIDQQEHASHPCYPCTNMDAHSHPTIYLETLFAARCRKMRPQRPFLKGVPCAVLSLFLACGPERDPKEEG